MDQLPKSPFESRTVWGGIIMILVAIAGFFGYTISPADQKELLDLVMGVVALIGAFLAIWGRVTATRPIKLKDH